MIKISNLKKSYSGGVSVIDGVSFDIKQGEIFAIVGHSGAGKSTLLRCINGLESYQGGSLKVDDKEVAKLNERGLRMLRRNIGMIFQHFALLSRKTVFENVAMPLKIWNYPKDEIRSRASELLELVGLSHRANAYPSELSGGQKQRVAIARALALEPQILLSDEATSALDPATTKQILALLKEINARLGITIVIVTHEMEVVKSIANRAILLEGGRITAAGATSELFLKPSENLKKFLGEDDILPSSGVNIRLFFPPSVAQSSIITHLARDLGVDISIVGGRLESIGGKTIGSLVINSAECDAIAIEEYISQKGVLYEVIN